MGKLEHDDSKSYAQHSSCLSINSPSPSTYFKEWKSRIRSLGYEEFLQRFNASNETDSRPGILSNTVIMVPRNNASDDITEITGEIKHKSKNIDLVCFMGCFVFVILFLISEVRHLRDVDENANVSVWDGTAIPNSMTLVPSIAPQNKKIETMDDATKNLPPSKRTSYAAPSSSPALPEKYSTTMHPTTDAYSDDTSDSRNSHRWCGVTRYDAETTCARPCPFGKDSECVVDHKSKLKARCFERIHKCIQRDKKRKRWCGNSTHNASLKHKHRCESGFDSQCPHEMYCFRNVPHHSKEFTSVKD